MDARPSSPPKRWSRISPALLLALAPRIQAAPISTRVSHLGGRPFPAIEASVRIFAREPLPALTRDAFRVTEDGKPVSAFSVETDDRPVYLALVLDRSGSMRSALPELKKAATRFVDAFDPRTHCQVLSFSDRVSAETGFRPDPRAVKQAIASLRAAGNTALYDAVGTGIGNLAGYPEGVRRVVVAFTDGNDGKAGSTARLSRLGPRDLVDRSRARGIPVFVVGLGEEVNREMLSKLAGATGGRALFATDTSSLASVFSDVAASLESGYRLRYQSPNPARDGTTRKVQITSLASGTSDQGAGTYRAPSDGATGTDAAWVEGRSRYAGVLTRLLSLEGFSVDVEVEAPGAVRIEGGTLPLSGSFAIQSARLGGGRLGASVRSSVEIDRRPLAVAVTADGSTAEIAVSGPRGWAASKIQAGGPLDAAKVRIATDPLLEIFPPLSLEARSRARGRVETEVRTRVSETAVVFEAPDTLRFLSPDGSEASRMVFDPDTRLPSLLVRVDPATGTSSTTRFLAWRTEGAFDLSLPELEGAVRIPAGAALDAAATALAAAGVAARAGEIGALAALDAAAVAVDASLAAARAGTRAGIAGARTGLEVARAATSTAEAAARTGLAAGSVALEMAEAATREVSRLGAWLEALGSDEARSGWSSFGTRVETTLDARASEFHASARNWSRDLDRSLSESAGAWQRGEDAFAEGMTRYGEAMDAAARSLDAAAEVQGRAMDLAGEAMDQAGAGLDAAGDALEAAKSAGGEVGEALGNAGRAVDNAGRAVDNAGRALDRALRGLGKLGRFGGSRDQDGDSEDDRDE